jgi:hypothetical protein
LAYYFEAVKRPFYIVILLLSFLSKASADTVITKEEMKLVKIQQAIDSLLAGTSEYNDINTLNNTKTEVLLSYLQHSTKEINYNYLATKGVFNFTQSKDKKFKILGWDTYTGGTMHFYESICVYQSKQKRHVKILNEGEDNYKYYYNKVEQVSIGNKVYYLPIGMGRFSTSEYVAIIENYYIDPNGILRSDSIFRTTNAKLDCIAVQYNLFKNIEELERNTKLIRLSNNANLIEIAIIDSDGKFLNRYLRYYKRRDGYYFKRT